MGLWWCGVCGSQYEKNALCYFEGAKSPLYCPRCFVRSAALNEARPVGEALPSRGWPRDKGLGEDALDLLEELDAVRRERGRSQPCVMHWRPEKEGNVVGSTMYVIVFGASDCPACEREHRRLVDGGREVYAVDASRLAEYPPDVRNMAQAELAMRGNTLPVCVEVQRTKGGIRAKEAW